MTVKRTNFLKELRVLSGSKLVERLEHTERELRSARVQVGLGKEKNIRRIRALAKERSQIWTVLRSKEQK